MLAVGEHEEWVRESLLTGGKTGGVGQGVTTQMDEKVGTS